MTHPPVQGIWVGALALSALAALSSSASPRVPVQESVRARVQDRGVIGANDAFVVKIEHHWRKDHRR